MAATSTAALLRAAASSGCRLLAASRGTGGGWAAAAKLGPARLFHASAPAPLREYGEGRMHEFEISSDLAVDIIPHKKQKDLGVFVSEDKVTVHFINRDGDKLTAQGKVGDSLLDVVIDNNLDIDGFGACEGTLACSTCHLIFEDDIFKKLDPITDEEMDMLDLAFGLTESSRLGCQICLKKSMNNMIVRVPEAVADARQPMDMSNKSLK